MNALSQPEFYQVCKWLEQNRDSLELARPTHVDLAKKLQRELGFTITRSNIKRACQVSGVTWSTGTGGANSLRGQNMPAVVARLNRIEAFLGELGYGQDQDKTLAELAK